jgi:hypothetical protein
MDSEPLVRERIEAGARFIKEFALDVPIKAAFWVKPSEEERWRLWVASDQLQDIGEAYRGVIRSSGQLQDPWFSPFDVKMASPDDPLVKAVFEVQQKYPGKVPMLYNGRLFKGVSVDQVYIYPIPIAVAG